MTGNVLCTAQPSGPDCDWVQPREKSPTSDPWPDRCYCLYDEGSNKRASSTAWVTGPSRLYLCPLLILYLQSMTSEWWEMLLRLPRYPSVHGIWPFLYPENLLSLIVHNIIDSKQCIVKYLHLNSLPKINFVHFFWKCAQHLRFFLDYIAEKFVELTFGVSERFTIGDY